MRFINLSCPSALRAILEPFTRYCIFNGLHACTTKQLWLKTTSGAWNKPESALSARDLSLCRSLRPLDAQTLHAAAQRARIQIESRGRAPGSFQNPAGGGQHALDVPPLDLFHAVRMLNQRLHFC